MLTISHVDDPEVTTAVTELVDNVQRLMIAGQFAAARHALVRVVRDDVWRPKPHGDLAHRLESLLPIVCLRADEPCPAFGRTPRREVAELREWAAALGRQLLGNLAMSVRRQLAPAGEDWGEPYFANLPAIVDPAQREQAHARFRIDAEFVMKSRLAAEEQLPTEVDLEAIAEALRDALSDAGQAAAVDRALHEQFGRPEWGHERAAIAEAAKRTPTMTIARAAAQCLEAAGRRGGYQDAFLFKVAMVLRIREGGMGDAAECMGALLAHVDGQLDGLVSLTSWEPMAEACRAGHFAGVVGVDAGEVPAYLAMLDGRRALPPPRKALAELGVKDTLAGFTEILAGSSLSTYDVVELPILATREQAYAFVIEPGDVEQVWSAARGLLDQTRRWPLVVTYYGAHGSPAGRLADADLFSRFDFEEGAASDDVSPRAIIARADDVDVDAFLTRLREADQASASACWSFEQRLEFHLQETMREMGDAPTLEDAARARVDGRALTTTFDIERWLMRWEIEHGGLPDPKRFRPVWWRPETAALVFLPTAEPWDALAYMSMYGQSYHGAEHYIALGRRWHQRYGAELACHYGTVLQTVVTRPPWSMPEALELAIEHYLATPDYFHLGDSFLRHHAAGILGHDRWFLHQRP